MNKSKTNKKTIRFGSSCNCRRIVIALAASRPYVGFQTNKMYTLNIMQVTLDKMAYQKHHYK